MGSLISPAKSTDSFIIHPQTQHSCFLLSHRYRNCWRHKGKRITKLATIQKCFNKGIIHQQSDSCSPVFQRRWSQRFFPMGGGRQGADRQSQFPRFGSVFRRNGCEFSHLSFNIFSAPGCVGGKGSYSESIMTFHYVTAFWISVCLMSTAHCLLYELIPTSLFCYLSITPR